MRDIKYFIAKINEFNKEGKSDDKSYLDINKTINNELNLKKVNSQKNVIQKEINYWKKQKKISIINILYALHNKNIAQIKSNFYQKFRIILQKAKELIQKKNKINTKEYISKYNKLFEENKNLSLKILEMNNKYKQLDFVLIKKVKIQFLRIQINDENLKQ